MSSYNLPLESLSLKVKISPIDTQEEAQVSAFLPVIDLANEHFQHKSVLFFTANNVAL